MRKPHIVAFIFLASGIGLAGCGQKGPLFLPADQAAQSQASAPASAEEKEKDQGEATQ